MRKLVLLLVTLRTSVALAAPVDTTVIIPKPPVVQAKAYLLMDAQSGTVLAADHPDEHLPPASLTKLMTLYIAFNALAHGSIHWDDKVHVSKTAWQADGSRMFLKVGTDVTVQDLVQGIIVASGNDASIALAEHIAGSESSFVDVMNAQAAVLGMKNSHFVDSNGLNEPDHYSSAQDLAILARAIITTFPQDYTYFSQQWFTYNNIKQPNRNRLLWHFKGADGLKTGHTSQAGYCLIGSALRDNMRLIAVVLGEPSDSARTQDTDALLTYGFRFFTTKQLHAKDETLQTVRVYFGENNTIPVGITEPLYVTVPNDQLNNVKQTITFTDAELHAPITQGQLLGSLTVTLQDKPMVQVPLVALQADPQGGVWRRFTDHVRLGFSHFFSGHATQPAVVATTNDENKKTD